MIGRPLIKVMLAACDGSKFSGAGMSPRVVPGPSEVDSSGQSSNPGERQEARQTPYAGAEETGNGLQLGEDVHSSARPLTLKCVAVELCHISP